VDLLTLAKAMKEKSSSIKRRKYDAAFKEEGIKMVISGRPVNEISQSLGIGENLIYRCKSRHKAKEQQQQLQTTASGGSLVNSQEVEALHRRVRELEVERDMLKKLWPFSAGKPRGAVPVRCRTTRVLCHTDTLPGALGQPQCLLSVVQDKNGAATAGGICHGKRHSKRLFRTQAALWYPAPGSGA
jgi:transposase